MLASSDTLGFAYRFLSGVVRLILRDAVHSEWAPGLLSPDYRTFPRALIR